MLFSLKELISIGLNIALAAWGIYQLASAKKEEENTKSKVRIWQNQAEGIKNSLLGIAQNPQQFSGKEDIARATQVAAQSAVAFDQSFVEERFYTDQEVKEKRERAEEEFKLLLQRPMPTTQVSTGKLERNKKKNK
jgi:hypothetical protein